MKWRNLVAAVPVGVTIVNGGALLPREIREIEESLCHTPREILCEAHIHEFPETPGAPVNGDRIGSGAVTSTSSTNVLSNVLSLGLTHTRV